MAVETDEVLNLDDEPILEIVDDAEIADLLEPEAEEPPLHPTSRGVTQQR